VADVLSSGYRPGDPGAGSRPPRRRWRALLAGGLVAAGAAYLAGHDSGGRPDRPPSADPSPSVQVRPAPNPFPTGPPATYRLDGDPGVGPAGMRLLVGGREPGVLDAGTGRLTPLRFPWTPGDVAELDHAGGTTTALLHNLRRLRARGVAIGANGRAAELGSVLDLLPLRDGSVLAEDCVGAGGTGPCTLTDYAATGTRRWRRTVPGRLDLVRDTPYGLLVEADQGDTGGVVRLEDPRTGTPKRVIGRAYTVLGADDRQVVFEPAACGSSCQLTLSDLATGSSRYLPDNPGNPTVAAFSADGRRIAIGYAGMYAEDVSPSPQRDGYVQVIDQARSDFWQEVPDLTTGPASTALPVWAPDGRLLLVVPTDGDGSGRVVVWRPDAPRITLLPVGLTGFYGLPGLAAPLS
jgi:WD40-like Beta Propeller Repeat